MRKYEIDLWSVYTDEFKGKAIIECEDFKDLPLAAHKFIKGHLEYKNCWWSYCRDIAMPKTAYEKFFDYVIEHGDIRSLNNVAKYKITANTPAKQLSSYKGIGKVTVDRIIKLQQNFKASK